MRTMRNTHSDYIRRVDFAAVGLANAERLAQVLRAAAADDPTNDYIQDAQDRARRLCLELEADMLWCMEAATDAGVDPDRWT